MPSLVWEARRGRVKFHMSVPCWDGKRVFVAGVDLLRGYLPSWALTQIITEVQVVLDLSKDIWIVGKGTR